LAEEDGPKKLLCSLGLETICALRGDLYKVGYRPGFMVKITTFQV